MDYFFNRFADRARKDRSKDSRLFLISIDHTKNEHHFDIHGTTGKVYTVKTRYSKYISTSHSCTCPDCVQRHRYCKHIYFIFYTALHFNENTKLNEMDEKIVAFHIETYVNKGIIKNLVGSRDNDVSNQPREIGKDDECVICFDLLLERPVDFCHTCLHSLHKDCIQLINKSPNEPACPMCRTPW